MYLSLFSLQTSWQKGLRVTNTSTRLRKSLVKARGHPIISSPTAPHVKCCLNCVKLCMRWFYHMVLIICPCYQYIVGRILPESRWSNSPETLYSTIGTLYNPKTCGDFTGTLDRKCQNTQAEFTLETRDILNAALRTRGTNSIQASRAAAWETYLCQLTF